MTRTRIVRAGTLGALITAWMVAVAGSSLAATTVTAKVGPAAVPGVPVMVCVTPDGGDEECVETPEATTIELTVSASVDATAPAPTITPGLCASADGVTAVVSTGGDATTVAVTVTVKVNGAGEPLTISKTVPSSQTVTISACAEPGVGLGGLVGGLLP